MSVVQKYIWPMILIIACVAIIVFAFLYLGQEANKAIQDATNQPALQKNGTEPSQAQPEIKTPGIAIYAYKDKTGRFFKIAWQNLPNGTTRLDIFRSKTGTSAWIFWKSLNVPAGSLSAGEIELKLASGDLTAGYSFYAEASSGTGSTTVPLWTSSSTEALPPPIVPPPAPAPSDGTSSAPNPPQSPTPPADIPLPPALVPPPSSTGTPPESTTTVYYYTPQGNVSGSTNSSSSSNFWVQHVNRAIEIGWQSIGAADKAVVRRSTNLNGPWSEIINQNNPADNYYIRLVDETLYTDYYYKLDIYSGAGIVASYGPIELPPLQ